MSVLRISIATLVGTVVIALQAGFFFGFLFADFFEARIPPEASAVYRIEVNYLLIVAADFLYAAMLAVLLEYLTRARTFGAGAVVGALLGFGLILHVDLLYAATTYLNTPSSVAANVAVSTVMSGIAGGVIAAILGLLGTTEATE